MADNFEDSAELADSPAFKRRVQVALMTTARDIAIEATDVTDPQRTLQRRGLAQNIFANPEHYTTVFAWLVASVTTITRRSNDAAIQTNVTAAWNMVAGVVPKTP